MKKSTEWGLYLGTFAVFALALAYSASADTINQNQSGNGNIQNVGGYVNSPGAGSSTAQGGNATANGGKADASSTAISGSSSKASADSVNLNSAKQGQKQTATTGDQSVSISNPKQHRLPVSSSNAPAVYAAWGCSAGKSLGVSLDRISLGGGAAVDSEACLAFAVSHDFEKREMPDAAIGVLCDTLPMYAKAIRYQKDVNGNRMKCPTLTEDSEQSAGSPPTRDADGAAYPSANRGIYE